MSETLTTADMWVSSWERKERGLRAISRRSAGQPWWHSASCPCEECLDVDMVVIELKYQTDGRPLFARSS